MEKRVTTICLLLGSVLGSYIPLLWGASSFSVGGIIFGVFGAIFGIWVAFRITRS